MVNNINVLKYVKVQDMKVIYYEAKSFIIINYLRYSIHSNSDMIIEEHLSKRMK